MEKREGILAAILFVLTSLLLPLAFRPGNSPSGELSREELSFQVTTAVFQLRLDESMKTLQEKAEQASEKPPADAEGVEEAVEPYQWFNASDWVSLAADLPPGEHDKVLKLVAVAALAYGREQDGRQILTDGEVVVNPGEPLSQLLLSQTSPDLEQLSRDLQSTPFPTRVANLLLERLGAPDELAAEQTIRKDVEGFLSRTMVLFVLGFTLFSAGVLVLAFSRRWLRRYGREPGPLVLVRFEAGPLQTYMVFSLWLLMLFTIGPLLARGLASSMATSMQMLTSYLIVAVAGVYLVKTMGRPRGKSLFSSVDIDLAQGAKRPFLFGLAGYLAALPVVLILGFLSAALFGGGESGMNPAIPLLAGADSHLELGIIVFNVMVAAPLFEEFLFRGFLFQQMRVSLGKTHAILLSALVFASVHLSIESFLPLFGLGAILAMVYHHTQSLWASILTHALWNGGTALAVVILFS